MIFIDKIAKARESGFVGFKDFLYDSFTNLNKTTILENEIKEFENQNNLINSINMTNLDKKGDIITVEEVSFERAINEKKSFSKTINTLITKDVKDKLRFGTMMHQVLERIDLYIKDTSHVDSKCQDYINAFLNSDLLKNVLNAKVYKEYEFYDEYKNINGSIDLMLEYDDKIDIIDYKLKNIEDEAYNEQLNGYKEYIERKTGKTVNIYLYSIFDKKYKEL
jgi:ATP-dependent exoDNAse (exonuclease V) beta subunit